METEINVPRAQRLKPGAVVVAAVACLVFVLDQGLKYLVVQQIGMGNVWYPFANFTFFRIIGSFNTGTACGYFPQLSAVFTLAPFLILAVVIYFYRSQKQPSWLLSIGVGLIIGGAFGNLVDRLRLGYVVDYVQVGSWPIFNVADASVSTAVVLMLLWSLREDAGRASDIELMKDTPATAGRDSSWRLGLVFVGALAVVAIVGYVVCVYIPANVLG